MRLRQAIALLSLVGFLVSLYLWLHALGVIGELKCGTGSCEVVQSSSYARVAGVPVALFGVVIERTRTEGKPDAVQQMIDSLDKGESLILFPEGTRNVSDEILLPFKRGICVVASAKPTVECVPVWIENLNRVMPKGEFVPIPLLCTLTFGAPLKIAPGEDKEAFLERTRSALLALCPPRA